MNRNFIYSLLAALLGVCIGALAVLCFVTPGRSSHKMDTTGGEWSKIDLVLKGISSNYVDTVDHKAVTEAALESILQTLDPHSVYMPPVELKASEDDLSGNFEGIGIQFNVPDDTARVLEVIPGGPAEKIGMQQGDRLIKVDTTVIAGVKFPQDSMVRRMKGPSGTKVTVTVLRDGSYIPFEITRDKIPMHSIDASFMLNDTTGYIRLTKFAKTTSNEFLLASLELLKDGMKSLVFDLRDNSGGYFDQALQLSNFFLDKGDEIVYMEGLHRKRENYRADGKGLLRDISLTVLINEGSASSSEIFAGAIQDNDRGVIIGRRSFGKGLVQEPFYMSDGSGIRLTVARFFTPSGRCIQKPYTDDYHYDIYRRYADGEMVAADSMKVNRELEYTTVGGRKVYGGGGIIPDVFVPVDTTRATDFYIRVTRKALPMRFASYFYDQHRSELSGIEDFSVLLKYLDSAALEAGFLKYAAEKDGLRPSAPQEWSEMHDYLMTQVRALVGRYSKLGDKAFYHIYLEIDNMIDEAMKPHSIDLISQKS